MAGTSAPMDTSTDASSSSSSSSASASAPIASTDLANSSASAAPPPAAPAPFILRYSMQCTTCQAWIHVANDKARLIRCPVCVTVNAANDLREEKIPTNRPQDFDCGQLAVFLGHLKLDRLVPRFERAAIDGRMFLALREEDLTGELGLSPSDAAEVMNAVIGLRNTVAAAPSRFHASTPGSFTFWPSENLFAGFPKAPFLPGGQKDFDSEPIASSSSSSSSSSTPNKRAAAAASTTSTGALIPAKFRDNTVAVAAAAPRGRGRNAQPEQLFDCPPASELPPLSRDAIRAVMLEARGKRLGKRSAEYGSKLADLMTFEPAAESGPERDQWNKNFEEVSRDVHHCLLSGKLRVNATNVHKIFPKNPPAHLVEAANQARAKHTSMADVSEKQQQQQTNEYAVNYKSRSAYASSAASSGASSSSSSSGRRSAAASRSSPSDGGGSEVKRSKQKPPPKPPSLLETLPQFAGITPPAPSPVASGEESDLVVGVKQLAPGGRRGKKGKKKRSRDSDEEYDAAEASMDDEDYAHEFSDGDDAEFSRKKKQKGKKTRSGLEKGPSVYANTSEANNIVPEYVMGS